MMDFKRVKISINVPPEATARVQQAIGEVGAGVIGEYSFCSFVIKGTGFSKPSDKAKPYKGTANKLEASSEDRLEVICDRDTAQAAITAMKAVHPHEEVAFTIVPIIDEDAL